MNASVIIPLSSYQVQYVDYGTMETIPVVHVYPTLLCDDVPQLCLPCQLHGLIPVRASQVSLQKAAEFAENA